MGPGIARNVRVQIDADIAEGSPNIPVLEGGWRRADATVYGFARPVPVKLEEEWVFSNGKNDGLVLKPPTQ